MSTRHIRNDTTASAQPHSRGFTLVELLVVIGIIALLISMLLPALNKAQAASRQIACASNLRTLGQAVAIYTAENHGYYPPIWWAPTPGNDKVHWPRPSVYGLLENYGVTVNSMVRVCPVAQANLSPPPNTPNLFSYIYSCVLGGDTSVAGDSIPGAIVTAGSPYNFYYDRPLKLSDTAGPNVSNTGMFCDCYQLGIEEGSGSTGYLGMANYGWAPTTTTTGTVTTVKILTDSWGGKHQALPNMIPVHSIQYLANGQIRGINNVCYCDGSVRGSVIQYIPGSINPIIYSETGLVPTVKP